MSASIARVVLAGGTGDLGGRVARALRERGANVVAIVRPGTAAERVAALRSLGADPVEADLDDAGALVRVCEGAACVVSTLSGLRETIVERQGRLLDAAVAAGAPRFIPSDYAADFYKLPRGANRNFDLRRDFADRLDAAPIRATSILNGAFMDMLAGQAPIIVDRLRRVLYWADADQPLDFTTKDDTASYTAAAALDPDAPRVLRIAGDTLSARQLAEVVSAVRGRRYGTLRVSGLGTLSVLIGIIRRLSPQPNAVFPPWQGMQYVHNMFSGLAKLDPLDNDRYPDLTWTPVRALLARS